jgi:hypothetical protein
MKHVFIVVGLLLVCFNVSAGEKLFGSVGVDTLAGTAMGSVADAKDSLDSNQKIGCNVTATATSVTLACSATTPGGLTAVCSNVFQGSAVSNNLLNLALSISEDSYVKFTWNTTSFQCTSLAVYHGSKYRNKYPTVLPPM